MVTGHVSRGQGMSTYRVSQNLPQICIASAYANMKHALKQMQYRFAVIYETLSTTLQKEQFPKEERLENRELLGSKVNP